MLILIFILVCISAAIALSAQAKALRSEQTNDYLARKIDSLEKQVEQLKAAQGEASHPSPPQPPAQAAWEKPLEPEFKPVATPPSGPPPITEAIAHTSWASPYVPKAVSTSTPPPLAAAQAKPVPAPAPAPAPIRAANSAPVDWEQFMGAKLFAWVGGLALFLGIAFFIKYSFDRNLIPPEMRAGIGFLTGIGLLVGGVIMKRRETAVTAQTLCSTGVLVLYGVTFACRSFYHFPFFQVIPTFLLMSLITAIAFFLSIRLNAMVVAVLGIAGGFLTPELLSTHQDTPLALFGYIALLDLGLLAVALRQKWGALPVLGAVGTVLTQIGWLGTFFYRGKYFMGDKVFVVFAIFAGFEALFIIADALARYFKKEIRNLTGSALAVAFSALMVSGLFLFFAHMGDRPVTLFGYVFLVDLGIVLLALADSSFAAAGAIAGGMVFALLSAWTQAYISDAHLYAALGLYLVFGLFHSVTPVALGKMRGTALPRWCNGFPALSLVLVLIPVLMLPHLSIVIWPVVLLIDIMAVILGVVTMTGAPILVALLLTLVATGAWIFRIPADLTGLPTSLFMLGGFAVFFIVAAAVACRSLLKKSAEGQAGPPHAPRLFGDFDDPANLSVQIPSLSTVLPFLLLIMVTLRLPLADPSPVFGLALLLVVLLMGLAKIMSLDALPAVGLACVAALEHVWHTGHFNASHAMDPFLWYMGFLFAFTLFPFLFHRQFANKTIPWATAALAGPLHFYLLRNIAQMSCPNLRDAMGLVPAALGLPALLGLAAIYKRTPAESPARNAQLAWFGGAALFFITLIFPVQFKQQWITIGWALEGAALCWLFHRVPHRGLSLTGTVLLFAVFCRLALNPHVLGYHPRAAMPVWNWYLYTYGIAAVCLFAGARLLAPPRNMVFGSNVPPMLYGLGTALSFLLVNIEIADYFTAPGAVALVFDFSGNFGRDMSYSIAWGLFALLLLIIGIAKRVAPVRYAGIGLLAVTLFKLFFHDLSQLDQLYRIAAFIVVAIIAIFASFLYQRFLGSVEKDAADSTAP